MYPTNFDVCVFIHFKIYFLLRFPLMLFLNLFLIGEKLLYNILLISALQPCEPAITIHISSATWASFPSSLHTALGNHRAPSRTPVLYRNFSPAIYFTHDAIYAYICWCYLPIHPTLSFPHCVHKSILYNCISIPSLQIGSSIPFF